MGEDDGAEGEDDGHGSDHECGVADGGEGESVELDEELKRDAEEGGGEEEKPILFAEARGA